MNKKIKPVVPYFMISITIIFILSLTIMLIRVRTAISEKSNELSELKLKSEEQRMINKDIERLFILGDDRDYVERIARARLGYVYPDEKVFFDVSGS